MKLEKEKLLDEFLKDDRYYNNYLVAFQKNNYRIAISKTMMFAMYCKDRAVKDFIDAMKVEPPFKYIYKFIIYVSDLLNKIFKKGGEL